jgi:hypothetical protein
MLSKIMRLQPLFHIKQLFLRQAYPLPHHTHLHLHNSFTEMFRMGEGVGDGFLIRGIFAIMKICIILNIPVSYAANRESLT